MDERPRFPLSEGLVVAAVPAYGYLLAYLYRRGFADELGIPFEFIQVELSDVLFTTVAALVIGTFLLLVAHVAFSIPEILPQNRRWRLGYFLGLAWLAVNVPNFIIFRHHLDRVWMSAITSGVIVLAGLWSAWSAPLPKIGLARLESVVGKGALLSVPVALLMGLNAHGLGTARALDQDEFLVASSTSEAVLAIYGQTAVLAPHSERLLHGRFRVVDVEGLALERRRIGPLKPPEDA